MYIYICLCYDVLCIAFVSGSHVIAQVMDFVEVVQGKIPEHLVHVGHEVLELPEFLAKRLMEFCGTKNCSPCSTLWDDPWPPTGCLSCSTNVWTVVIQIVRRHPPRWMGNSMEIVWPANLWGFVSGYFQVNTVTSCRNKNPVFPTSHPMQPNPTRRPLSPALRYVEQLHEALFRQVPGAFCSTGSGWL